VIPGGVARSDALRTRATNEEEKGMAKKAKKPAKKAPKKMEK
jgi:hypothetical protein